MATLDRALNLLAAPVTGAVRKTAVSGVMRAQSVASRRARVKHVRSLVVLTAVLLEVLVFAGRGNGLLAIARLLRMIAGVR